MMAYPFLLNIFFNSLKERTIFFPLNPEFSYSQIKSKKWISLKNYNKKIFPNIKFPINGDQCWGIEPPCAISKNNLKHYFKIN